MTDERKTSLRDSVLDRIRQGDVTMRPRWHFLARGALIAVGIVAVALAVVFAASLLLFTLQVNGTWFVPAFGWEGVGIFLWSLPLLLIVLTLVFLVLLEILVRHYTFVYRGPLLYSALAILALASIGGFFVSQTSLHGKLLEEAERDHLPVVGPFYRSVGNPQVENVYTGTIAELSESGFLLKTRRGKEFRILVTPVTRFPYGSGFETGDTVVVYGVPQADRSIEAAGIRKIPLNLNPKANSYFYQGARH